MEETMTSELKQIFDFVQKNGWSNARQIGKAIPGGKSRANHFLYGYLDILFVKRGIAPPQWSVISEDAYDAMLPRIVPIAPSVSEDKSERSFSQILQSPQPKFLRPQVLPMISVCGACGLPIQPTGKCGCS
jgi:hypothetical protein